MNRTVSRNLLLPALAVFLSVGTSGCLFFGRKVKSPLAGVKAAPDKVLYDNAMNDIQHGRFTIARLDLQTLINTYPESEYLAKAKLATADSYYRQGGTDGLTQAVSEYKDFITFFPFLNDAAFAQYRVAMAHYRMMEKPDRDRTQSLQAEAELQTMILKYPKSKWTVEAKQRLREVQEVLAEGDFEVADFYDIRGAYAAAAARLLQLTERYPLFSEADQANFMLGAIYQKTGHKDFAARFYSNVVREYPLSNLVPEAKKRLTAMEYQVPLPDPKALARMKNEEKFIRERPGVLREALGIFKSGPDVSRAAHYGEPNLTADTGIISARQVLTPSVISVAANSAGGNVGTVSASTVPSGSSSATAASGSADAVVAPAATSAQAQASKDPTAGAKVTTKITAENSKESDSSSSEPKKKGLLHKIIPF